MDGELTHTRVKALLDKLRAKANTNPNGMTTVTREELWSITLSLELKDQELNHLTENMSHVLLENYVERGDLFTESEGEA
jgi:hypothetical protein